jgi:hypothetical protein
MSQDNGMDATIDWEARAKAAEHSNKVLTAALEKARKRLAEEDTVWNKDARAALQGILSWRGWECGANVVAEAKGYADALEAQRQARPWGASPRSRRATPAPAAAGPCT